MMRFRGKALCAGLLLSLGLSGCWVYSGTIEQGVQTPGPAAFGGIRMDFTILGSDSVSGGSKAMAVFDLPIAFVLDTVLLPFSILNELISGGIVVVVPPDWEGAKAPRPPWYFDTPTTAATPAAATNVSPTPDAGEAPSPTPTTDSQFGDTGTDTTGSDASGSDDTGGGFDDGGLPPVSGDDSGLPPPTSRPN
jgi:uncharacterized protein YceK